MAAALTGFLFCLPWSPQADDQELQEAGTEVEADAPAGSGAAAGSGEEEAGAVLDIDVPGQPPFIFLEQAVEVTSADDETVSLPSGGYVVERVGLATLSVVATDGEARAIVTAEEVEPGPDDRPNSADVRIDDGNLAIRYTSPDGSSFRVPLNVTGVMSRTYVVYPDPDLIAMRLSAPSSTIYTDRNIVFRTYVQAKNRSVNNVRFWLFPCANLNRANHGYYCYNYVSKSGSSATCTDRDVAVECIIDRIPVNEARRVDITVRLKDLRKQTPTALLKVDGWNQIRESSETNNQKTRSYTAHQRTDLTIRFCGQDGQYWGCPNSPYMPTFYQGQRGYLVWEVSHTGSLTASGITISLRAPLFDAIQVNFRESDSGHGFSCTTNGRHGTAECTGGSLGGSKPDSVRFALRVKAANMIPGAEYTPTLTAEIDPDNTVRGEVSETNNTATKRALIR